jgi:hypothetical protein
MLLLMLLLVLVETCTYFPFQTQTRHFSRPAPRPALRFCSREHTKTKSLFSHKKQAQPGEDDYDDEPFVFPQEKEAPSHEECRDDDDEQ